MDEWVIADMVEWWSKPFGDVQGQQMTRRMLHAKAAEDVKFLAEKVAALEQALKRLSEERGK